MGGGKRSLHRQVVQQYLLPDVLGKSEHHMLPVAPLEAEAGPHLVWATAAAVLVWLISKQQPIALKLHKYLGRKSDTASNTVQVASTLHLSAQCLTDAWLHVIVNRLAANGAIKHLRAKIHVLVSTHTDGAFGGTAVDPAAALSLVILWRSAAASFCPIIKEHAGCHLDRHL